jgi:single-strand DNA-binding protein
MNSVHLFGNLGADPELKMLQSGTAMLKLRVATSERRKDSEGEWKEHTEWHSVVVWAKMAEALSEILRKGMRVLIDGQLRTRSWEDDDGNKRYMTEVHALRVELPSRADNQGSGDGGGSKRSSGNGSSKGSKQQQPAQGEFDDDDIPF